MPTLMLSRQSWPRGLKVLFWLEVLVLVIGSGQTLYWHFVTHEFFPHLTLQGAYALLALPLGVACVALGAFGRRRAFATTALGTAAFHITITALFNLHIIEVLLPDILAGRFQALLSRNVSGSIWVWNLLGITANALVCYYLLRYEFRVFESKTAGP